MPRGYARRGGVLSPGRHPALRPALHGGRARSRLIRPGPRLITGADRLDARAAVLARWVFDLEGGAPTPHGFDLLEVFSSPDGYLGALLRCADPDGGAFLVSRGTRFDTRSPAAAFRGLRQDLGTASAILRAAPAIPALTVALDAAIESLSRARRTPPDTAPLRLVGQSLGGGLAQFGAAACLRDRWTDAAGLDVRCITFGAMDVSDALLDRFGSALASAVAARTENHVAARDGLTGPRGVFGASRVGAQRVRDDLEGPRFGAGLAFHRARAWTNHCAGRPVDAPEAPYPATAADWGALRVNGWLPDGWPAAS